MHRWFGESCGGVIPGLAGGCFGRSGQVRSGQVRWWREGSDRIGSDDWDR